MKKRIISIILALAMVLSLVPAVAFADYVDPIDQAFEYSTFSGYSQSNFDHAHDMDASLELGQLGAYFLSALTEADYYEDHKGSYFDEDFDVNSYIVGVRAAYHEAVLAIEKNPKLATYILNLASLLPYSLGEALAVKNFGLAAYFVTAFQELVADMKVYPDKAETISVLGYALLNNMNNYTDTLLYTIKNPVKYAVALHAAYLEARAYVDKDPMNAYYLTGVGEWFINAEAQALAPWFGDDENNALASYLYVLCAQIANDLKENPDDAKYLATLGLYEMMYIDENYGFIQTVEAAAKLNASYLLVKETAKKYPELKRDIYYLGIYLFYSDAEIDSSKDYDVYVLRDNALSLATIAELALQYNEIIGLMVKYPELADGIALSGGEMIYALAQLDITEPYDYAIKRTMYKEAFLEILVSLGVSKKVVDEYSAAVEKAHSALAGYTDVVLGAWYYEPINYCMENGAMTGISETEFGVNAPMTNGEVVNAIATLKNIKLPKIATLNLEAELTREDLAVIIYTYVKMTTPKWKINEVTKDTNTLSYNDIFEVSESASEAVHYCLAAGILKGDGNGNVNPTKTATKAEIATVLYRFLY